MAKVVINYHGTKAYINDNDQFHREDGPAIIWRNGRKEWRVDGERFMTYEADGVYTMNTIYLAYESHSPNGNRSMVRNGEDIWPEL